MMDQLAIDLATLLFAIPVIVGAFAGLYFVLNGLYVLRKRRMKNERN